MCSQPAVRRRPPGGQVTLKAMYWSASPEDHKVFENLWDAFQQKNAGIKIDFDDVPSAEFSETLLSRIVGGQPPDVVKLHPAWVLNFINAKQLNDVTDRVGKDISAFIPAQVDFWKSSDRLWGVPYYSGPSFLYYNKTLFQKAGAKTPEEHEKAGTWTWDTFRELAKQLAGGSGAERTFGFDGAQQPVNLQFYTCVPIWSNQAEIINKDETAFLIDQPGVVEVLQWHADMQLKDKSIPIASDFQGISWLFKTGRVGMAWAGRYRSSEVGNVQFDVGMVGVPKGKVGPINRDGPNATGLPIGTKNLDAAFKVAMFIGSSEAAPVYLGGGASQPVRTDLLDSPDFKKSLKPFERLEVLNDSSKTVRAWRVPGKGAEIGRALTAEWDKVLAGQQDVSTALKNAKATMDPLLKAR